MLSVTEFMQYSSLSDFAPLPRSVLRSPLSGTAKLLYALLLDRGTLSQKNGYTNGPLGHVYVVYPVQKLAGEIGRAECTVQRALDELERACLIMRQRDRTGYNRIYLYIPDLERAKTPVLTGWECQVGTGENAWTTTN